MLGAGLPSARFVCAAAAAALCAAAAVKARMVQFGVVAFPNQTVEVSVGGQRHRLAPPDMYAPYYWGNYDVPDTFTYKYIVDGAEEPFDRGGPDASRTKTYNDFYGRQHTVVELPRLPQPFGDGWTRSLGYTPLFDDSYIPTFHLAGDPVRINDVWTNMAQNNTAAVTMTVVLADYVLRFEVRFSARCRVIRYKLFLGTSISHSSADYISSERPVRHFGCGPPK
ncbi:MAG: hypothetical protein BJ554DRAFT_2550 [Olpidium bornovanus]|uniref:Uncharacterized protein n=1 Tax=Olpidium bornovanus TaxID=278681 RepID=A0A8H7ZPT5_9FUNG|nr:MAG: hypothetical protein BJ554DRAFT_2550 [Olpidium bornovanus]